MEMENWGQMADTHWDRANCGKCSSLSCLLLSGQWHHRADIKGSDTPSSLGVTVGAEKAKPSLSIGWHQ